MIILPLVFIILILYFLNAFIMMRVYKRMNYDHAWFSFIPVLSDYIAVKFMYDGLKLKDKQNAIKENRFVKYVSDRKIASIIIAILITVIGGVVGATSTGVDPSSTEANPESMNITINFSITLVTLAINFVMFYASILLFKNPEKEEKSPIKTSLIYILFSIITFGIYPLVYFYKLGNPSDEYEPVCTD